MGLKISGHRGASGEALENTIEAVERAFFRDCEGVEVDVRVTKDPHAVTFHDYSPRRFGGPDVGIDSMKLTQLNELNIPVPRLADVLDAVPSGRSIFLDIKTSAEQFASVAEAIKCVARTNIDIGFQAYDPHVLARIAEIFPTNSLYWLAIPLRDSAQNQLPYRPQMLEWMQHLPLTGCAADHEAITDEFVDAVRSRNLDLYLWTVNGGKAINRAAQFAPDWIETDDPQLAKANLASRTICFDDGEYSQSNFDSAAFAG